MSSSCVSWAMLDVEPSAVESGSVGCHFLDNNKLKLTWDAPWNGGRPQGYSIWDHNSFREYLTTETSLTLTIDPTKVTQVWIRPSRDDWRGKYTSRIKVDFFFSHASWNSNSTLITSVCPKVSSILYSDVSLSYPSCLYIDLFVFNKSLRFGNNMFMYCKS